MAKLLLDNGAQIDATNGKGETALMIVNMTILGF